MPILFLIAALSTGLGLTVDLAATMALGPMEQRVKSLPWIHIAFIGVETLLLGMLLITALVEGGSAAQSALTRPMSSPPTADWAV